MFRILGWPALLSCLLFLSSCSPFVENNTIEEIAPVIYWSINSDENGQLQLSTLVPPLTKEKQHLLTINTNLLQEVKKNFNLIYYREMKVGQLRLIAINEKLARKGILSLTNTLWTDPNISQRLYLVVIEGSAENYLRKQVDKQENIDYFLYRMLRHYERKNQGEMTVVNLHQFMKSLYSPFADPILPVYRADEDNFKYEGTAIFRGDVMVGAVHSIEDQVIQLIGNDHYLKLLLVPPLSVAFGNVRSKVSVKISPDYASMSITVDLNGRLMEYRGNKLVSDPRTLANLNQGIEDYLEKTTVEVLQKLQRWKADPLNFGANTLKPFRKPISDEAWMKKWANMKLNVQYRVHLQPLAL